MKQLYFDHAATTVVLDSARKAAIDAFDAYGNPSSVHSMGIAAKKIIDNYLDSLKNEDARSRNSLFWRKFYGYRI